MNPLPTVATGIKDQRILIQEEIRPYSDQDLSLRDLIQSEPTKQQIHDMMASADYVPVSVPVLAPAQYDDRVSAFFDRVFAEPQMTLADTAGSRVIICWRIVKTMARDLHFAVPGQSIEEILSGDDTVHFPWTEPIPFLNRMTGRNLLDPFYRRMIQALKKAELEGLPLAPPKEGAALDIWHKYFMHLATKKGIPNTPSEAADGKYGLRGLADPVLLHLCWPPLMHLLAFEEDMLSASTDVLVAKGAQGLKAYLRSMYAFGDDEFLDVQRMVQGRIRAIHSSDIETDRAMLIARLESIADRAQGCGDLRAELGSAKALMVAQGISKDDSGDIFGDFVDSMKRISEEETEGIDYDA